MFYELLQNLCSKKGTTVTAVLKLLNISTSKGTAWKNGSIPNGEIVKKISDYFEVSTDYLLGKEGTSNNIVLDKEDEEILLLARKTKELPEEERKALIKLLNSTVETVLKAKGKL